MAENEARTVEKHSADAILDRIKRIHGDETDVALSARLEIPHSTVSSWRRRGSVPLDILVQVAKSSGHSLDWLILGIESPQRNDSPFDDQALELAIGFTFAMHKLDQNLAQPFFSALKNFYAIMVSRLSHDQTAYNWSRDEAIAFNKKWLDGFIASNKD